MKKYHQDNNDATVRAGCQRWADLLIEAVNKPGSLLKAYSTFHGYSIGNQFAALFQCQLRGIEPGPINTYPGWQRLGRQVRKGQKAIWLCMPITIKRRYECADSEDKQEPESFTSFVWKPNWFVLTQTDGQAVEAPAPAGWDKSKALAALNIIEGSFQHLNGNVQGYARAREIAINPVAALPHKTTFHETAHIVLGHTAEGDVNDDETIPRNIQEVEAEAVALICCEALGLGGAEYCRGYIQNWLQADSIPERSARRIFKAADQILRAGEA